MHLYIVEVVVYYKGHMRKLAAWKVWLYLVNVDRGKSQFRNILKTDFGGDNLTGVTFHLCESKFFDWIVRLL